MGTELLTSQQILELVRQLLSPPMLLSAAGILLSVIASYLPWVNEWWAGKGEKFKPLCMLGAITFLTLLMGFVSFTHFLPIVPATQEGVLLLSFSWVMALVSNYVTYKFSPQTKVVKDIKLGNGPGWPPPALK